jgi:uncharacterized membrane protein
MTRHLLCCILHCQFRKCSIRDNKRSNMKSMNHPITRFGKYLFIILLLLSLFVANQPSARADGPSTEPEQRFTYSQSSGNHNKRIQQATASCYGLALAQGAPGVVYGQGYLNCTGTTAMSVQVNLWKCNWGGTYVCGSPQNLGLMGPWCSQVSGSLWCPNTRPYPKFVSSGCYMVVAYFTLTDIQGIHYGSATSSIVCN